jgi:hypothetical protein
VSHAAPLPALGPLLREKQDAVVRRWTTDVLATYPEEAAALFEREQDRFANPVGHSVRAGTQGIVAALCDGLDPDQIRAGLREIIQVRAIQQFSPSRAVGFVFRLKDAIRAELAETAADPASGAELAALDEAIEGIALIAFDVYTECRERVYQLRLEEAKRRVTWVVDHLNRRAGETAEETAEP